MNLASPFSSGSNSVTQENVVPPRTVRFRTSQAILVALAGGQFLLSINTLRARCKLDTSAVTHVSTLLLPC